MITILSNLYALKFTTTELVSSTIPIHVKATKIDWASPTAATLTSNLILRGIQGCDILLSALDYDTPEGEEG